MVIPGTATVTEACIVSFPTVDDVVTTLQEPPLVWQSSGPVNEPTDPGLRVKLTLVPFGGATNPPPVPALTNTCAVYVWVVLGGLVASVGVIVMYASTTVRGSHGPSLGAYVASP